MDKNNTQNNIHNTNNKDLFHINDVIFKDSIQSAITPNKDIAHLSNESSINTNIIPPNTLRTSIKDDQDTLDTNMTGNVKTSSTLNNASFATTKAIAKFEDNSDSFTSSKDTHQNHTELLKDLDKIPDRMAFKISEVSDLAGIKSYVLRYWESEFEQLKPKKAMNNRRMYTQKDVTTVLLIKKLLYKDKYSIEGAKKALKYLQADIKREHKAFTPSSQQQRVINKLKDLICDISSLKKNLSDPIED